MTIEEATRLCREHTTVPLVPHGAKALGLSSDAAYKSAAEIGAVKIGHKWIIATRTLARLIGIDRAA